MGKRNVEGGANNSEAEEKFRVLAEYSPNMIFVHQQGRVVYANKKCEEEMGYTREEFYSPDFGFLSLITPETRPLVKENLKKHMKGEEVLPYEYGLVRKDGRKMDVIISSKLISLEGESAILGVVTDITQRKHAEEELRRSEERFKIMFDYAPDAFFLTDSEGVLVDGNKAAEELLGFSKDESSGNSLIDMGVIPEDEIEKTMENLIDTIKGNPTGPNEVDLIGKDDRRITVETRTYPVKIDGEDMMLASARDITEQKHLEEAKSNLLSNISHELRTPLTSIEGYTKFILSGKLGEIPENQEKCLRVVDEESDRLKGLIDNFLDLLTIDAEGLRMKLERIPVPRMIDTLISSLNLQLEMKGISFSTEMQEDLGFIKGDENRLHQLLSNLLSNAIKFTPQGGSIVLRSCEKDSNIILEVEDSGVGILPEDLPHVFDRFYQVDGSPSRRFGGVGLGLAICSEIVEAHGGHIEVESQYGKGSIFRVELPKYLEVSYGEEEGSSS